MDASIIGEKACELFSRLPKKGKPIVSSEWTTMAAIVQEKICYDETNKNSVSNFKTVSLGTGTKCLGQNDLSKYGDVVSDSHAEIVARRAFLLYLYEQLEICCTEKYDKSIFVFLNPNKDECKLIDNVKLRDNVSFHMFISHLPCGDSAVISDRSGEKSNESLDSDEPPSKMAKLDDSISPSYLKHRTGAKLQVGPLQYETTQSIGKCRVKPGKGDPTLCMSCSDKIAKWQILGLQGALLSVFIKEPIRLKSFTIGGNVPFSEISLQRAVYNRIFEAAQSKLMQSFQDYLVGYQSPIIKNCKLNFMQFNDGLNPAPASISWYCSSKVLDPSESVQVIVGGRKQGATKKNFGKPSAMAEISRARIFARFKTLYYSRNDNATDITKNYGDCKCIAEQYSCAWNILKKEVFEGWTEKPKDMKAFS